MKLNKNDYVLKHATYLMWLRELNATVEGTHKPDWRKRRIAAEQICEMTGIKDVIRAVARDGALRPPPQWPQVDCVPVGGGPGMITCEVRTWVPTLGKLAVKIALTRDARRPGKASNFDAGQIREAVERGTFELRKRILARD